MNAGNQPLIVMHQDCACAVTQVTTALESAGYLVQQSFNLSSARHAQSGCACDQDLCQYQMVILLVYAQEGPPVTLVFDSDQSQTLISLATGPSQPGYPSLIGKLPHFLPNVLFPMHPISP